MAMSSLRILPGEPFPPASLELGGGQETPIGAEIGSERMVDGAGHVSGDGVDGFDRAGEALRRARVHQEVRAGLQGALEVGGAEHGPRVDSRREARGAGGAGGGLARLHGAAGGDPGLEAAVEDGHRLMSQPAQHPPQTSRHR